MFLEYVRIDFGLTAPIFEPLEGPKHIQHGYMNPQVILV